MDRDNLLNHYQRRHIHLFKKYKDNEEIPEVIEDNTNKTIDVNDSQMLSTTSLERVRVITEELLGVGVNYAGLDEVEEVIF